MREERGERQGGKGDEKFKIGDSICLKPSVFDYKYSILICQILALL